MRAVARPRQASDAVARAHQDRRRLDRVRVDRPRKELAPARPDRRIRFLSVVAMLVLLVFSGRLVQVQAFQGEALAQKAQELRYKEVPIPAVRGEITDANGVVLATSVTRYEIFIDQPLIEQWEHTVDGTLVGGATEAARLLAPVLGLSAPELAAQLVGKNKHKIIATDVAPEVWEAVRGLKISGVFGTPDPKRSYPAGTTGGNLVGFVGAEGTGQSGLEYALDDTLSGTPGVMTFEQGYKGHRIPTGEQSTEPASPGSSVRLTIDNDLQWTAQAALERQVAAMGAEGGWAVVQDLKTGEILALADAGSIDPNNPTGFGGSKATSTIFDPGSTAKVITMAALIESGLATPTTQYTVGDTFVTPNAGVISDSHPHPEENWTLTGILADSSNAGTVMAGQSIPVQVRHDYLTKFGFGAPTGIELAGEEKGLLWDAADWDGRTEYNVLFGQGLSVTALQATNVFATIGNGGLRTTPHLVAGTTAPDGAFTPSTLPEPVQVVSESTADQVLKMMESAVVEGTGSNGAIEGYRVAGKTGTAQMPDENGELTRYLASFIGVAPVDDPQLAIGVFIDNPKVSIFGGTAAAPVFSELMAFGLQQRGVAPTGTAPDLYPATW